MAAMESGRRHTYLYYNACLDIDVRLLNVVCVVKHEKSYIPKCRLNLSDDVIAKGTIYCITLC